jgi:hypothetical protein
LFAFITVTGKHKSKDLPELLLCAKCRLPKPTGEFGATRPDRPRGKDYYCRTCRKAIGQSWAAENKERRRLSARVTQRAHRVRLRHEIIAAYGAKCACCGETEPQFLTLDHPAGIPPTHRLKNGRRIGGFHLYQIIKREGFPSSYRLLCWNCNASRAYWGSCPHERHQTETPVLDH